MAAAAAVQPPGLQPAALQPAAPALGPAPRQELVLHIPGRIELPTDTTTSATGGATALWRPCRDLPGATSARDSGFRAALGRISSLPAVIYTAGVATLPSGRLEELERRTSDIAFAPAAAATGDGAAASGGGGGDTPTSPKQNERAKAALGGYYHVLESVECVFGEGDHGDAAWRRALAERAVELYMLTLPFGLTVGRSGMKMVEPLATAALACAAMERGVEVAWPGDVMVALLQAAGGRLTEEGAGGRAPIRDGALQGHIATIKQCMQYQEDEAAGGGSARKLCPSPAPSMADDAQGSLALAINSLKLDNTPVATLATQMLDAVAARPELCRKRQPSSVAAAVLYAACKLAGKPVAAVSKLTQATLCQSFSVTDMTMRGVLRDILEVLDGLLPPGYVPTTPKEEAFPQLGPWSRRPLPTPQAMAGPVVAGTPVAPGAAAGAVVTVTPVAAGIAAPGAGGGAGDGTVAAALAAAAPTPTAPAVQPQTARAVEKVEGDAPAQPAKRAKVDSSQ